MTYRSDLDALRARERALAGDLAAIQRARDEAGQMLAEAEEREAQERREIDCMRAYPQPA